MKGTHLFPYQFKRIGWIIAGTAVVASVVNVVLWRCFQWKPILEMPAIFNGCADQKFFTTALCTPSIIIAALLLVGLALIGFSKERIEDEFVEHIRMRSLVWAALVCIVVFVLFDTMVFGLSLTCGATTFFVFFLLLFVVRFRIELRRASKGGER